MSKPAGHWPQAAGLALAMAMFTGCASTAMPPSGTEAPPAIISFSDNHVTIRASTWPGPMANAYCQRVGKAELLVSRTSSDTFHFACLARECLTGEVGVDV